MLDLTKIRSVLDTRSPNHSLPQEFYVDPDVFAFDLAVIYQKNWFLAGFEAELPKCGSYLLSRSDILPWALCAGTTAPCAASTTLVAIADRTSVQPATGTLLIDVSLSPRTYGLDGALAVGPTEGTWWHTMRFPLNDGAVTLSMDGRLSCTKLLCDAAHGDIGTLG